MLKRAFASLLVVAAMGLAACEMRDDKMMKDASLYDRLGGKPAIEAVVDEFTARMAADERVNGRFANTDIPEFKMHLVNQICEASGGPCKYTGRTMKETHKGMGITREEFNITGGHLAGALDKFNVPEKEKNELLTLVGSMRDDIVGQ